MLRTAVSNSDKNDLLDLSCDAWEAFIRSCDIESLGPQLSLIFVSLLPLLKRCFAKANNIMLYLIQRNYDAVNDNIVDLFFVTQYPDIG